MCCDGLVKHLKIKALLARYNQYNTPNFQAFGRRSLKTRAVRLYIELEEVCNFF
jgi:hypothetical protein